MTGEGVPSPCTFCRQDVNSKCSSMPEAVGCAMMRGPAASYGNDLFQAIGEGMIYEAKLAPPPKMYRVNPDMLPMGMHPILRSLLCELTVADNHPLFSQCRQYFMETPQ